MEMFEKFRAVVLGRPAPALPRHAVADYDADAIVPVTFTAGHWHSLSASTRAQPAATATPVTPTPAQPRRSAVASAPSQAEALPA